MSASLRVAVDRLSDWFRQDCLPFWRRHSIDPLTEGGVGRLSDNQNAALPVERDVRDIALLAWTLSVSDQRGWCAPSESVVRQLHIFAGRHATRPCRSDGYVRRLSADLTITDDTFALTDHAEFMRSSLAAYEVYGSDGDYRRALNILDWLDYRMRSNSGFFYRSGLPAVAPYPTASQLPLLEVFLYLYRLTRKDHWLERATGMAEVFRHHFYDVERNGVVALVDESLRPAGEETDAVSAARWAQALLRLEQSSGPASSETFALCQSALAKAIPTSGNGLESAHMLARVSGTLCLGFQLLADGREVSKGMVATLNDAIEAFFEFFGAPGHPAGYIDGVNSEDGQGVATAEGLFHICRAVVHADKWMNSA